jgi:flagellin
VSLLQTQDGALKVAAKILDRISELRTLNDDVTKSTGDKANYNTEFVALTSQLTAIASEKFNGVEMFGTSSGQTVNATEDAATASQISLAARDLTSTSTGLGAVTAATALSAITSIDTVKTAIENVATMRASNGAEQSRLGFASELLTVNKANLEAATSRITDVDVAEESTQLARWNTLVSAGTSMLSQANQSAQTALRLLQ